MTGTSQVVVINVKPMELYLKSVVDMDEGVDTYFRSLSLAACLLDIISTLAVRERTCDT